jgi:hypothetical protein
MPAGVRRRRRHQGKEAEGEEGEMQQPIYF